MEEDGIDAMSNHINSPAARRLLRWRIETVTASPAPTGHLRRHRLQPAPTVERRTGGLPELDAAPGGTLRSFGIAREALARLGAVESTHEWVDFVPTVSAVAIRDIDQHSSPPPPRSTDVPRRFLGCQS